MALGISLSCAAALLALGVFSILLAGNRSATNIIYTASLLLTLGLLANAILHLLADSAPETTILPLGLPWVGAHFTAGMRFRRPACSLSIRCFLPG